MTTNSPLQLIQQQARVIDALMVREVYTRFGRENIGFLWIIVEPAMFCLGVVAIWSMMKHSDHAEINIIPFVLTGYLPLTMFRHTLSKLMRCMQANASLLYHRQVTVFSLYMARIVIEFLSLSFTFAVLMFLFWFVGWIDPPDSFGGMFWAWLLYCWFIAALGMTIGALAERSEVIEKFWGPVSYFSIPFSGAFYLLYWLPDEMRAALLWSPQVNSVEMLRGSYYGPGIPTYGSATYVAGWALVLTFTGLLLVSTARHHIEVD